MKLKPRARWVFNFVAWVLLLLSLFVLLTAVFVPRILGATPYTILTSSMEPSYPPGTLVVAVPTDPAALEVGDIITYQLESGQADVVTHRIVAAGESVAGETFYRTQGDANPEPDEYFVRPVQVRGKMMYHVPYLGYVSNVLVPEERGDLNKALALGLIVYAAYNLASGIRARLRRKPQSDKTSKMACRSLAIVPVTTALLLLMGFTLATASGLPSGAYWTGNSTIVGTSLTSGTTAPQTLTPYCTVWNTLKNRAEDNATCSVSLSVLGCTQSWSTAANVYLRFTTTGVKLNGSDNYGNGIQIRFAINLQALGCNPPGVNWTPQGKPGISVTGSFTTAANYACSQLPLWEGSTGYFNAGPSTHLGTLYFDRTNASVTCAK